MKSQGTAEEPSPSPARDEGQPHEAPDTVTLETVLHRDNLVRALKRAKRKPEAAPGIDGMTVPELGPYLNENWQRIQAEILAETYTPAPVRRVEIPKPGGQGKRMLGIPRVLDRFLQQALLQVLMPVFEPGFSEHSKGFRPGRNQHQAVREARSYIAAGYEWVVDMDLEKFFDRVNHDILMARVARRVRDPRVLRLIRKYLESGVMIGGVVEATEEGTPQGGPLSPLLSNILLDDLDKELERRGHKFVRFADDANIYVRSRRAGERVLASVSRYLETRLKLKVNREKSAVDRPWRRKFLGFSFFRYAGEVRVRVATQRLERAKAEMRNLTRRMKSEALSERVAVLNAYLRGWVDYFALAQTPSVFQRLDEWLRRRLRSCLWKQWKRAKTRGRNLRKLGANPAEVAKTISSGKGPWRIARTPAMHQALGVAFWRTQGLLSIRQRYEERRQLLRTA